MRDQSSTVSRRSLFAGAATVGAKVVFAPCNANEWARVGWGGAASSVLPSVVKNHVPAVSPSLPKPERGGGYSLSEHVQQYYKTTRI